MPELLIVGALALIVIGPKDLPRMMRSVGKFVGQARGLAKQFQDSMNDAAREADIQEFRDARKLLDGKASTKGISDTLNETFDLDSEDDKKPKSAVLSDEDMAKLADESGFGKSKPEPEPEPAMEPLDRPDPEPAQAADAKAG